MSRFKINVDMEGMSHNSQKFWINMKQQIEEQ